MSLGTVLILGGSSGIGLGIATEVIKTGAKVVIGSSSNEKIAKVVEELNKTYASSSASPLASGQACNLSDPDNLEANVTSLLEFAAKQSSNGKISHIVHCAGAPHGGVSLQEYDPTKHFAGWTIRYSTAFILAKLAPKFLIDGPESSITLTSGTSGHKAMPGTAQMVGQPAAIEALARAFAIDLCPIRVNCVAPGYIETPLMRGHAKDDDKTNQKVNKLKDSSLLKRIGTPYECAQSYLYFMRDTFQTGSVVKPDGGRQLN